MFLFETVSALPLEIYIMNNILSYILEGFDEQRTQLDPTVNRENRENSSPGLTTFNLNPF